jgi:hypothetical protein
MSYKQIKVNFIYLDQGKFLHDPNTNYLYNCARPHQKIGILKLKEKALEVCLISKKN